MPRKTKREKLQADLRKQFSSFPDIASNTHAINTSAELPQRDSITFEYHGTVHTPKRVAVSQVQHFSEIRADLIKTLLLAAAAFTGEFVLYVVLKQ